MFDQPRNVGKSQRYGEPVVPGRFVAAPERLIGDCDRVVRADIFAVEHQDLVQQLHCRFVAAVLLRYVAEQHQASHVLGIVIEDRAA